MDAEAARLGISRSEWIRLAHVLASHILTQPEWRAWPCGELLTHVERMQATGTGCGYQPSLPTAEGGVTHAVIDRVESSAPASDKEEAFVAPHCIPNLYRHTKADYSFDGWRVCFIRRKVRFQRYFSDRGYGGAKRAYEAALHVHGLVRAALEQYPHDPQRAFASIPPSHPTNCKMTGMFMT